MAEQTSRGEIFVVDDDPAVRDTLSMVLKAAGYEVICFADGAALLSVARSRTPAAILLDVHIPGKSGLDILRELHGEDYPAPIFMISGQGDIAMAVGAIKSGALDFIEKPFRGSEIVGRLDEAIGAYARRQAENASPKFGSLHFPGREPLTRREREVLEQFAAGRLQQGGGPHARHQPAHHRGSPRQHHEEARRPQCRRSDPHRDDRSPARVVRSLSSRHFVARMERSEIRGLRMRIDCPGLRCAPSGLRCYAASPAQRLADDPREIGFAIGFCQQQNA